MKNVVASPAVTSLLYAEVICEAPLPLLTYSVPIELKQKIKPGTPVVVPLGSTKTYGYVANLRDSVSIPLDKIKSILDYRSSAPILPANLLALINFAANYYCEKPGVLLKAALPRAKRTALDKFIIGSKGIEKLDHDVFDLKKNEQRALEIASHFAQGFSSRTLQKELQWSRERVRRALIKLMAKGFIEKKVKTDRPRRQLAFLRLCNNLSADQIRTKNAQTLWSHLLENEPVEAAFLAQYVSNAYSILKKFEARGWVKRVWIDKNKKPVSVWQQTKKIPVLTEAQKQAVETLREKLHLCCFHTYLLHGITGSGKTEVYLHIIAETVANDKSALVLVPEIALTPQLSAVFRARFGDRVAIFHSALSPAERRDEWERVRTQPSLIAIGARSALFLPLKNIGVIVVDEEHDASYKQDEVPRYHARDLAIYRAYQENALVILGSATPSLESYKQAKEERYSSLLLPDRIGKRELPSVSLVNMTQTKIIGAGLLSEKLVEALQQVLVRDEQAILFLNRRGFAPFVHCPKCGFVFRCPDCNLSLTLHKHNKILLCHYCAYEEVYNASCQQCGQPALTFFGFGTEGLEKELKELLGNIPMLRLDRDTIRSRSQLDAQLSAFKQKQTSIMFGTQMVVKGHDFPGVTLVGVLAADAGLNFPDFRAAERTFQLLTQVAGRAGRGSRSGHVIIQSYETEHYAIQQALKQDYNAFVEIELENRRLLQYPPYGYLALLRVEDPSERQGHDRACHLARLLRQLPVVKDTEVKILGPAPAPLRRLRRRWRFQILVKAARRSVIREIFRQLRPQVRDNLSWIYDIDPYQMM